jgi:hypothetical protein
VRGQRFRQRTVDCCQYGIRFHQNLIVPKSQNTQVPALQHARPALIIFVLIKVLRAVELNDEMTLIAHEVDDIAGDLVLPPEFETELVRAQTRPK